MSETFENGGYKFLRARMKVEKNRPIWKNTSIFDQNASFEFWICIELAETVCRLIKFSHQNTYCIEKLLTQSVPERIIEGLKS